MKHSAVLCTSLVGALILGASLAYADPPPTSSVPDAATVKRARDVGMKPEFRKGVTLYCWEDADVGTRFKSKKCVDESRLEEIIVEREAARDLLHRGGGNHP